MKKFAIVLALLMTAGAANAALFNVELAADGFQAGNPGDQAGLWTLEGNVQAPGTNATWTYDDTTGNLVGTGILTAAVQPFGPNSPIFSNTMDGVTISSGVATSDGYSCVNGIFAEIVGSNVCGGYNINGNGDESTVTYSNSGRDVTVVLGGDDTNDPESDGQTISFMDMSVVQFDGLGGSLILETADWFNDTDGVCAVEGDCDSAGSRMTLSVTSVVPVPAAVWLFGSGLGLLGWMRRRVTA